MPPKPSRELLTVESSPAPCEDVMVELRADELGPLLGRESQARDDGAL